MTGSDGLRSCDPLCNINAPFHMFKVRARTKGRRRNQEELRRRRAGNTSLPLFDYPSSRLHEMDIFVGMHMFGVTSAGPLRVMQSGDRAEIRGELFLHRACQVPHPVVFLEGRHSSAKGSLKGKEVQTALRERTLELFEMSKTRDPAAAVSFNVFGDEIANHEMMRGAVEVGCHRGGDQDAGHSPYVYRIWAASSICYRGDCARVAPPVDSAPRGDVSADAFPRHLRLLRAPLLARLPHLLNRMRDAFFGVRDR